MKRLIAVHGTISMYANQGCRCTDCRAASASYMQSRRRAGLESKASKSQANKKYYQNHTEAHTARVAAWRKKVGWDQKEYGKQWRQNNKEKVNELSRQAKARKRFATIHRITPQQIQQKLSMFTGCWMCGGKKEQVDHVKPLAKGGYHILANLRPACGPCNNHKKATWPIDFRTNYYAFNLRVK